MSQKQYERYGNFIINKSQSLGEGSFGHVWKGYLITQNNDLEPVAIKQSYNETSNIKEIQTLQILNHPNIIQYKDFRITGNSVFMVMELCENGTLDDLMYSFQGHNTQKIIGIYSQIVNGVKFMYNKKILHRDIKPSNILITRKNVIKIADFGTSKIHKGSEVKLKTLVGTPLFSSPQLLEMRLGEEDTYTDKSEIWALGLILYYMFNYDYNNPKSTERIKGSLPWSGRNTFQILQSIKKQPLVFKKPEQIPQEIQDIIKRMLKVDLEQRMSFQELFEINLFSKKSYDTCFLSVVPEDSEERTINETKREIIDWELLELLQRINQEEYLNDEKMEYCDFYQMIIDELNEVFQKKYAQFLFELEMQLYLITPKIQDKKKIQQKYPQKSQRFSDVVQVSPQLEVRSEINYENYSLTSPAIADDEIRSTQLHNELQMTTPSDRLIVETKNYIKDNINIVFNKQTKKANVIHLIYDLFTLLTLQKSWQMKKRSKASISQYKKMRNSVKLQTIISRITKACESIKI